MLVTRRAKMRARLLGGAAFALATLPAAAAFAEKTATFPQAPAPPGPPKAIVGASVVDVVKGVVIPNAVVIVDGDKIVAVGPASSVPVPQGAEVIHMDNKWLEPGLINCHVHLDLILPGAAGAALKGESLPAEVLRMQQNAAKALYSGVTTIRLTGTTRGADFALKQAINAGEVLGPRIETAGEIIGVTGGHDSVEADGPAEFAKVEREQIKQGASWIKLAISGGIADSDGDISASPMTVDEMKAAIDVAHRLGVPVTAHNGSPVAAEEAMAAGIDGFEHGYHLTEKNLTEMKAKGVWLVPTIVVSDPGAQEFFKKIGSPQWYLDRVKSTGEDHWRMLQTAIKLGNRIALGTDQQPFEPNAGTTATIREAELYQKAGMKPIDALRAGTLSAAQMLRRPDVGAIEAGRYADLIATDTDPTKDIAALRTISFVMKGGQVIRDDAATKGLGDTAPAMTAP
jgi:imidazolonepropionase-like amidohydrolase